PAVSPTTRNRSGLARTMSSAWVPTEPVDPSTTTVRWTTLAVSQRTGEAAPRERRLVAVDAVDPVDEVVWMVRGVWVTMCLSAGCRLGVFDALHEPTSAAALAASCHADEHALTRLLAVL